MKRLRAKKSPLSGLRLGTRRKVLNHVPSPLGGEGGRRPDEGDDLEKALIKPFVPLTLTLSPQGRGDMQNPLTLTLSPQGRGDVKNPLTLTLSPQGRGDKTKTPSDYRAGFTILEMIVAMLLLGTAMGIVVPVLGWMGIQNRLSLQRQEAVQGLNNLMDELTARPYAELTPETAGKVELSESLTRQLPGAKLQVEITQANPNAKRIQARLSWDQQNGQPLAPVRLTAWVHQREGQP